MSRKRYLGQLACIFALLLKSACLPHFQLFESTSWCFGRSGRPLPTEERSHSQPCPSSAQGNLIRPKTSLKSLEAQGPLLYDRNPWDERAGGVVTWMTGEADTKFMNSNFGRQWMLRRWPKSRIPFTVNESLDLLNALKDEASLLQYSPAEMQLDVVAESATGAAADGTYASMLKSVIRPEAASLVKLKSAAMTKANGWIPTDFLNKTGVCEFLTEQHLRCDAELADQGDHWTFILNRVQGANHHLRALHHAFWAYFGLDTAINAYMSAPDAQGLGTHTDPHDVFVLQLEGEKLWHILEGEELSTQHDFILTPGDVLYVPAGVYHYAESLSNVTSLHITAGVYRDYFTTSALLAAWLELEGRKLPDAVTGDVASRIDVLRKKFASYNSPWHASNQLLEQSLIRPLLRGFDASDLPHSIAAAASENLVQVARALAVQLQESSAEDDVEDALRLDALIARSEPDQLVKATFALREHHWVKHYDFTVPKDLAYMPAGDDASLSTARLRRRADASAMCSSSGALFINGYRIVELPEGAMPAFRYCMGLYTGASGKEFSLADVPGRAEVAVAAVRLLLRFDGLEQVVT